jgi:hypothetical protein
MASEKGDLVRAADVFQEIGNESMQSNLGKRVCYCMCSVV